MTNATGWFWTATSTRAHADDGTGRAMCGRANRRVGAGFMVIDRQLDAAPERTDCGLCRRAVDRALEQQRAKAYRAEVERVARHLAAVAGSPTQRQNRDPRA